MTMDYSEIPGLAPYYLEDSFVLAIEENEQSLTFDLELVLTEKHPDYSPPKPGEQYCYADGRLVFNRPAGIDWISRHLRTNTDAAGEEDLGNIDFLKQEGGTWRLGGDWGEVLVTTDATPSITLHR
ncbi:hypothetical protein [Saccharopolyspora gregorii]|uniref:hypothetical protein n=1 Tax=Saccharopolyspora gregorii TaxID=33914 RepID=UPI0021AC49AD|nr:hypothetical protein [Saccharopolyspora gregorii]